MNKRTNIRKFHMELPDKLLQDRLEDYQSRDQTSIIILHIETIKTILKQRKLKEILE